MNKEKAICFAGLMESYLNIPSFVCELIEKKLIEGKSEEVIEYIVNRKAELNEKVLVENKVQFVSQYLKPLLLALGEDIVDAEYKKTADEEIVIVSYEGGGSIEVNVHMDSPAALCRDVLKSI